MIKRRKFIRQLALSGAASALTPGLCGHALMVGKSDKWGEVLPERPLGQTGEIEARVANFATIPNLEYYRPHDSKT